MPYTVSIEARCRFCGSVFGLRDLLLEGSGRCPNCDVLLAPDWSSILLEEAANAEKAQELLVGALRRLVGLPGWLEVLPASLIRNFFEEIGWSDELASDPEIVERELRLMRQEFASWERIQAHGDGRREASRFHRLARLIRRLPVPSGGDPERACSEAGAHQDATAAPGSRPTRPEQARRLDHAADLLDAQANELEERRATRTSVLATIDSATKAVRERRHDR